MSMPINRKKEKEEKKGVLGDGVCRAMFVNCCCTFLAFVESYEELMASRNINQL